MPRRSSQALLFVGLLCVSCIIPQGEVAAQSYFLNGTAQSLGDDCYQLTTTQGNQNGTIWYSELIDLTQPFDLNFTMNFGTFDETGADGMVFVRHPDLDTLEEIADAFSTRLQLFAG